MSIILLGAWLNKSLAQDTTARYIQFMGQVDDESKLPIPGVILKNLSRNGITSTSNSGTFIMVVAPGDIIQFSFAGFKVQKVRIPLDVENTRYVRQIVLSNDTILLRTTTVHAYPEAKAVFTDPFPDMRLGDGAVIRMDHAPIIKAPNPITSPISAISNAVQKRKMKNSKGGLTPYNQSLMIKDFFKEGTKAVPDSVLIQYHK